MFDNSNLLRILRAREAGLRAIRRVLSDAGALEVVTPIASTFPDLAPVRQLTARHPTNSAVFVLRIAPEEHLTRLIARGIPAVFEIATNFRAEVLDATHLIEFQSVEAIFAHGTPMTMRALAEEICRSLEDEVRSAVAVQGPRWCPLESFEVVHLPAWVHAKTGNPPDDIHSIDGLRCILARLDRTPSVDDVRRDSLADQVIGAVASHFTYPVFITSLPDYLGGPARPCPIHPGFLDRSELYVGGLELGSLADQVTELSVLRERYALNHSLRSERGIEPNVIHEPCLEDYALGLPPYCGLGLGIDRLLMLSLRADDVRNLHPFLYE
jgi:lysyl-tRNA synthetase, class II